ncbi:MAG: EAL domain-containing protein [Alphaproteobacteria bacterium]|nr:EAL domain-containing protein [Alphaproteobacteria bacterium]
MGYEFSILIDKTGKVFRVEGEIAVVRTQLPEDIKNGAIYDLIPEDGYNLISKILDSVSSNTEGRISDIAVMTSSGETRLFHMTVKPEGVALWWFHFVGSDTALPGQGEPVREPTVIWVDFFDSVSYLIDQAPDDKPIELMMLSFEALNDPGLSERLGADGVEDVRAAIESTLNDRSLNGQVGRLDDNSYTIVCDADTEVDEIVVDVGRVTQEHGVELEELGARAQTVILDKGTADSAQMQGALSHIRRSFLEDDDDDEDSLIGGDGPLSLSGVIEDIEISKERIVTALDAGDLELRRYPVVAITTGEAALHLVHGRLLIEGVAVQASRKLIMGDFPGLTLHHDTAMAREAVRQISVARAAGAPIDPIVIDVNASSLGEPEFASNVATLLSEFDVESAAIGFRTLALDLTKQSTPNFRGLLGLLERGHPVWLTRFTAAVTDSTLDGAYIEVTAAYLQRLCGSADGFRLVSQLLEVWRGAQVRLVAMDVQSDEQVTLIGELGIEYAVGPAVTSPA